MGMPPITSLLAAMNQPAVLVGPNGSLQWGNSRFRELFTRDQVPPTLQAWEERSPPHTQPLWLTLERESTLVRRLHTSAGVDEWRMKLIPARGGDAILLLTNETEGPESGRDRAAVLEAIFENLNEGVIALNADEKISAMSAAAERMTGFDEGEVIGLTCRQAFQPPPDVECPFETLLRTRKGFRDQDMRIKGKEGRQLHVKVNATPIADGQGEMAGAVVILHDLAEIDQLRENLRRASGFHGLVGTHPAMQHMIGRIETVAPSEAAILVLGESGTGKELVARAIHELSDRRDGPFVKVNCGSLAESLLESELFGHVKGAFTGALRDRAGRFETADGGTLFLDEVGDMPASLQIKLLRVLQEGEYERVGESITRATNVRILSATHRDLREEIDKNRFREDLFYRLCVVPIQVPALRERPGDIPVLAEHFLRAICLREGRDKRPAPELYSALSRYHWPGNVRELENAIAHAYVCSPGEQVLTEALPEHIQAVPGFVEGLQPGEVNQEAHEILSVLQSCAWNREIAAQKLGLSRTTLWRRMKRLGLAART